MRMTAKLRRLCRGAFLSALLYLSVAIAYAQKAGPFVLVANQADRDISILDPVAGVQVAVVPEWGITGHEVAASPDGRTAYVPIYGDSAVGARGTDGDHMIAIDIPSRKIVGMVDFGHGVRPHCVVYDPHSGMLYITTELDNAVTIVNPRTLKVVGKIPTGQIESHMLAISHDGKRGYTANVGAGSVSVLDLVGRKTIAVIPISKTVQRISISNDDSMVFTADQVKPQLAVIDTATNKVKAWIRLPAVGYGTAPTRDGRYLLVAMEPVNQIAVVDLHSLKVVRTISVPKRPSEILTAPNGRTAFIACGASHQVAAIDLSQWKVERLIGAGDGADGLAWAR
jgi:DNA-binding beta-propeller fold protein YncE